MKKRKPPYLLLSILIVFIGVAVIFNPLTSRGMAQQEPVPEEMPAAGESRETETSEALAAKAAGAFSASTPSPAGPQRPSGPPEGVGPTERMPAFKNNPSVVVPDSSLNKPVPNDSGISSHWYRENHVKQKQGK